MSTDMKLIMENWRANTLHEQLVEEFVKEIKTLTEAKAELNEILAKVGEFAKKAYNTYSDLKKGTIKKVLETAINAALKLIPAIKQVNSGIASKIERALNALKQDENMTVAISIVSIIVGLMTGEAFSAVEEVLGAIDAAPNLIKAYEAIANIADTADIAKVASKSGQLVNVAAMAQ